MASNTGENEVGLRKITDMTRLISLLVLALHFYYFCYRAFHDWHLTFKISDRILEKISNAGLFTTFNKTKLIALSFLVISLVGVKGKKGENFNVRQGLTYILIGLLLYFPSSLVLKVEVPDNLKTMFYMVVSSIGFLLIMLGGSKFSRHIAARLSSDIFNKENETFPQFEFYTINFDDLSRT